MTRFIKQYFTSIWRPSVLSLCLIVLTSVATIYLDIPFVVDVLLVLLGLSLLLILSAAVYQLACKTWHKGLANISFFLLATLVAAITLGVASLIARFLLVNKDLSIELPIDIVIQKRMENLGLSIRDDVTQQLTPKGIEVSLGSIVFLVENGKEKVRVYYYVKGTESMWWDIIFRISKEGLVLCPKTGWTITSITEDVKTAFSDALKNLCDENGKPRGLATEIRSFVADTPFHQELQQIAHFHLEYIVRELPLIITPSPENIDLSVDNYKYTKWYKYKDSARDEAFVEYSIRGELLSSNITEFEPHGEVSFYYKPNGIIIRRISGSMVSTTSGLVFSTVFHDGIVEVIDKAANLGFSIQPSQRDRIEWKRYYEAKLPNNLGKMVLWKKRLLSLCPEYDRKIEIIVAGKSSRTFRLLTDTCGGASTEMFFGEHEGTPYLHLEDTIIVPGSSSSIYIDLNRVAISTKLFPPGRKFGAFGE